MGIRGVLILILGTIIGVFALQNTEQTTVTFLVWELVLPRILLILAMAAIGYALGALTVTLHGRRKSKEAATSA